MTSSILRSGQLIFRLPSDLRSKLAKTMGSGVAVFVLGFAIWNADNYFCAHLRAARAFLTNHNLHHLGHFTQGHGYWHLMTGYGAYLIFTACIQLCLAIKTTPEHWDYDSSTWLPVVKRVKPVTKPDIKVIPADEDKEDLEEEADGTVTP